MGDVVTALGRAVQEEGHRVEVILPKFDCINYKEVGTWADARPSCETSFTSSPCQKVWLWNSGSNQQCSEANFCKKRWPEAV